MLFFLILKRFGATRGLKETSRIGITSLDNTHYPIQYDTLKGHFDNKMSGLHHNTNSIFQLNL